jgi:hypothetical protein
MRAGLFEQKFRRPEVADAHLSQPLLEHPTIPCGRTRGGAGRGTERTQPPRQDLQVCFLRIRGPCDLDSFSLFGPRPQTELDDATPGCDSAYCPEPALLLWGVPIPLDSAPGLVTQQRINAVSDGLGERPDRRSEPDVILDFADDGVVFIEVKLRSDNDSLGPASPKWDRYLDGSHAFVDRQKAKDSGLYELCRNWRIAFDAANNRPAKLINLGPETLWRGRETARLNLFRESLTRRAGCAFLSVSWRQLLDSLSDQPDWLRKYVSDRGILV